MIGGRKRLSQRKLPRGLVGGLGRRFELLDERPWWLPIRLAMSVPRATTQAPVRVARSTGVGALLGGQLQGVGQHKASLGIGVVHFDGLAATDLSTSPRPIAAPPGMFSVHMR